MRRTTLQNFTFPCGKLGLLSMLFKCSVGALLWLFNLPNTETRMLEFPTWRIGVYIFFITITAFVHCVSRQCCLKCQVIRVHLFIHTSNISRACILCQFLCLSLRIIISKNQSKGEDRETNALKTEDFSHAICKYTDFLVYVYTGFLMYVCTDFHGVTEREGNS